MSIKATISGAFLVAVTGISGCGGTANAPVDRAAPPEDAAGPARPARAATPPLAPEAFGETDLGIWDGRPSLGGVWVAHPDVTEPERVLIRNDETGRTVTGALFRRERISPGPRFQVSAEAAIALQVLPGAPVSLTVTAFRSGDGADPVAQRAAPAGESGEAPVPAEAADAPSEAAVETSPGTVRTVAAAGAPGAGPGREAGAARLAPAPAPPRAPAMPLLAAVATPDTATPDTAASGGAAPATPVPVRLPVPVQAAARAGAALTVPLALDLPPPATTARQVCLVRREGTVLVALLSPGEAPPSGTVCIEEPRGDVLAGGRDAAPEAPGDGARTLAARAASPEGGTEAATEGPPIEQGRFVMGRIEGAGDPTGDPGDGGPVAIAPDPVFLTPNATPGPDGAIP